MIRNYLAVWGIESVAHLPIRSRVEQFCQWHIGRGSLFCDFVFPIFGVLQTQPPGGFYPERSILTEPPGGLVTEVLTADYGRFCAGGDVELA